MGERRARSTRWTASRRRLAATVLAALGVLALAVGAGLVGPWPLPAASRSPPGDLLRPVPQRCRRGALCRTLPALPPGPVPLALAAFSLPVGARLALPAGPGPPPRRGGRSGACWVSGSTTLLAATAEAVAPPIPVAAGGARPCRARAPSLSPRPGRPSSSSTPVVSQPRARSSPSARRTLLPPTRRCASSRAANSIRRRPARSA